MGQTGFVSRSALGGNSVQAFRGKQSAKQNVSLGGFKKGLGIAAQAVAASGSTRKGKGNGDAGPKRQKPKAEKPAPTSNPGASTLSAQAVRARA